MGLTKLIHKQREKFVKHYCKGKVCTLCHLKDKDKDCILNKYLAAEKIAINYENAKKIEKEFKKYK